MLSVQSRGPYAAFYMGENIVKVVHKENRKDMACFEIEEFKEHRSVILTNKGNFCVLAKEDTDEESLVLTY
jgi:hypothetical protein